MGNGRTQRPDVFGQLEELKKRITFPGERTRKVVPREREADDFEDESVEDESVNVPRSVRGATAARAGSRRPRGAVADFYVADIPDVVDVPVLPEWSEILGRFEEGVARFERALDRLAEMSAMSIPVRAERREVEDTQRERVEIEESRGAVRKRQRDFGAPGGDKHLLELLRTAEPLPGEDDGVVS